MSLIILTKSPIINILSLEFYKNIIKRLTYRTRGPQAVIQSLITGLDEIGFEYKLNPNIQGINENSTVWVNESIETLKFAIGLKKLKRIKKLIVGPNIVITPDDKDKIIQDDNIDICLVPSQWVKDFYSCFGTNEFKNRLKIWAAGVLLKEIIENSDELCLVYKKDINYEVFKMVVDELTKRNLKYKIIEYGKYRREDYFKLLNESKFMIYLQSIESQGIAMFEAWERDVPTLIYLNNTYINKNVSIFGNISAPYLSNQSGMFFDYNNFNQKLDHLINNIDNFQPREYIKQNFTNKLCAEKFLELIK